MENKQVLKKQLMQSIDILARSDRLVISKRLGEVAILKGITLTDFQLKVWVDEIEKDLQKGLINAEGVKKALEEMPKEKTYANLDYYSFYELAKVKSDLLNKEVIKTKEYLENNKNNKMLSDDEIKKLIKESIRCGSYEK